MTDFSRLPRPVAHLWEWQLQGACRSADAGLFFHTEHERGAARRSRAVKAVAVCQGCPVIRDCRSHALSVREPYGVWGGLTEDDREQIYRAERQQGMSEAS